MIDVHTLAAELGISSAVVLRVIDELGGTTNTAARLSAELADQVRERLRGPSSGFVGAGGNPLFSVTREAPSARRPERPGVTPAFAPRAEPARPRQQAKVNDPFAAPGAYAVPEARPAPATESDARSDSGSGLEELLAEQARSVDSIDRWKAAGLGAHDVHLIARCEAAGLTPEDLRRRFDGQTIASRLKNGESMSSVRSRLDQTG
ncbi:MAG: hypothetical protein QOE71_4251 [Pseudonocardiales bacterium]|nr:hypothetical protein [Pseudonocardiales bacterium]